MKNLEAGNLGRKWVMDLVNFYKKRDKVRGWFLQSSKMPYTMLVYSAFMMSVIKNDEHILEHFNSSTSEKLVLPVVNASSIILIGSHDVALNFDSEEADSFFPLMEMFNTTMDTELPDNDPLYSTSDERMESSDDSQFFNAIPDETEMISAAEIDSYEVQYELSGAGSSDGANESDSDGGSSNADGAGGGVAFGGGGNNPAPSPSGGGGGTSQPPEPVNNAPTAVNDVVSIFEDEASTNAGNVLANDFHVDGRQYEVSSFETLVGNYGTLSYYTESGDYEFQLNNWDPIIQALAEGQTLSDTFNYTIVDINGLTSTATLEVIIIGVDDPAVVTGDDTAAVTEDVNVIAGNISDSGILDVDDIDNGENGFQAATINGLYGSLTIDDVGNWTYSADNSQTVIQELGVGDTLTETIMVTTIGGDLIPINITIHGTDDPASLVGDDSGQVTEDTNIQPGNLLVDSGVITATDIDAGESGFVAETISGLYGDLTIDALGNWTYSADNSQAAIQGLDVGDTLTDSITVTTNGGDTTTINVVINGTEDLAVIIGDDNAQVTEDTNVQPGNLLEDSGTITATDPDAGESGFVAETISGLYGSLTIDALGNWTYSADNSQAVIQGLDVGDTLTETFTVTTNGGETTTIDVVINGAEDIAIIIGDDNAQVTEDTNVQPGNLLEDSGTITATDPDPGESGFMAETISGLYGSLTIDALGNWTYSADNSQAAIQGLDVGDTLTETFTVTTNGGDTTTIDVVINGTEDVAVIIGDDNAQVTEDTNVQPGNLLEDSGTITATDPDPGESGFVAETISGVYGSLTIDALGNWIYSADNSQAAIQGLDVGDTLTETFTVTTNGGDTTTIDVVINGTEDIAVIIGDDNAQVTEDTNVQPGNLLEDSGTITATDPDPGESGFMAETISGTYGSLTIDALGNWTYSADNSQAAIQGLDVGDTLTETFTVTTNGGDTTTIDVVINGAEDVAVIVGDDTAQITEDTNVQPGNTLVDSGTITATDPDPGESGFVAETISGLYGSLSIDALGNWTYTANNTNPTIQQLGVGDTLTESITVTTLGGDTTTIDVTINGVDDLAIIIGDDDAQITEDTNVQPGNLLEDSGTLTASDVDLLESGFVAETIVGTYGSLTIDALGNWTYSADNSQAVIQNLDLGDTLTESITVTTLGGDTTTVDITIHGVDDAAIIVGDDDAQVTEDTNVQPGNLIEDSGTLTATDPDPGESGFVAETISGTYGDLTIDALGNWTYSADNSQAQIQGLDVGDTLSESFTVTTLGGDTTTIDVVIHGTEDVAVIIGDDTAQITEDTNVQPGNTLVDSGTITATDPDPGESGFVTETISDLYGSLSIDALGNWTYTASNTNPTIQQLGVGDTLTESITVTTLGGDTTTIDVTINGVDDLATIIGDDDAQITEDTNVQPGNLLEDSGTITATDIDSGESGFVAETIAGLYGSLTIDALGNWTYTANNANPAIQQLGIGDSLTESITVTTNGGETTTVDVTINGTDDPVNITGDDTAQVTEDTNVQPGNLIEDSGTITATDPDAGESGFVAETIVGTYGSLTIDALGNWTYTADNSQASIQQLDDGDPPITESFNVTTNGGDTATINVSIFGIDDLAVITGDDTAEITEDTNVQPGNLLVDSGTITATDPDVGESGFVAETIVGLYGSLTIDALGNWTYTADNSQAVIQQLGVTEAPLTESITVTTNGGETTTVNVTINGVNDDPEATNNSASVQEGTPTSTSVNIAVVSDDNDIDGDSLTITEVNNNSFTFGVAFAITSGALVTVNANGTVDYDPNGQYESLNVGDTAQDTFTYTISDGHGGTDTATVRVTINGENDRPVVDLNGAAAGNDYNNVFVENGSEVNLADNLSADVSDVDNNEYSLLTISATGITDGADEQIVFDSTNFFSLVNGTNGNFTLSDLTLVDISISGFGSNRTITIQKDGGGDLTDAQMDEIIQKLQYINTAAGPSTQDRIFNFSVTDADGANNNPLAVSTIDINQAPVLNTLQQPEIVELFIFSSTSTRLYEFKHIAVGDIDGDGDDDIAFAADATTGTAPNSIVATGWFQNLNGVTLSAPNDLHTGAREGGSSIHIDDFAGNGVANGADIAASYARREEGGSGLREEHRWFRNPGDENFTEHAITPANGLDWKSSDGESGFFDPTSSGADLVVAEGWDRNSTGGITIYSNNGTSLWTRNVLFGDADGDIRTDPLGSGPGSFSAQIMSAVLVRAFDADNDGDLDLIVADDFIPVGATGETGFLKYIENTTNGGSSMTFANPTTLYTASGTQAQTTAANYLIADLEIADLNGDGETDILSYDISTGDLFWMESDGDGTFQPTTTLLNFNWTLVGTSSEGLSLMDIEIGDANLDGFNDLILGLGNLGARIYFNDGSDNFNASNYVDIPLNSAGSPKVMDIEIINFDGDAFLDLVITTIGPNAPNQLRVVEFQPDIFQQGNPGAINGFIDNATVTDDDVPASYTQVEVSIHNVLNNAGATNYEKFEVEGGIQFDIEHGVSGSYTIAATGNTVDYSITTLGGNSYKMTFTDSDGPGFNLSTTDVTEIIENLGYFHSGSGANFTVGTRSFDFQVFDASGTPSNVTNAYIVNSLPPIVLDLDNDGVEFLSRDDAGARFDFDGDGQADVASWASSDDGILVYDHDEDNQVTSTSEFSFVEYDENATTDLEGLRAFDSNHDGKLDANDEEFSKFKVWQDKNSDGKTDEGELHSLSDLGIESIDLTSDGQSRMEDDVLVHGNGSFNYTDGRQGELADTSFMIEQGNLSDIADELLNQDTTQNSVPQAQDEQPLSVIGVASVADDLL